MLQLQIVKFTQGSYIVVEGKSNNESFYIIQQGLVQCTKSSGSGTTNIKYGPGDFVGVVPCMASRNQIETAIALTSVTLICVKREQYPELIAQNTPVALKIIKTFANRMRVMNEMLTQATLNSVVNDDYDQIFNVAQYYEKSQQIDIAVFAYYQYLKTQPQGEKAEYAKKRFIMLKKMSHAVYFEPTPETSRIYPKGTMIFSESQRGSDMFIIQKGEVAISKVVKGNEVTLAVLKKGDMFGEMALIENKPRSASAIAHSDCQLMVINRSNFNQMVATQPQLIAKLTTTLADRLWSMYRQLENANLSDPFAKVIDMLALQLEKQRISLTNISQPSYQTNFSPKEITNMCGLAEQGQTIAINGIYNSSNLKIEDGNILIKDTRELLKQSAFYRKNI